MRLDDRSCHKLWEKADEKESVAIVFEKSALADVAILAICYGVLMR